MNEAQTKIDSISIIISNLLQKVIVMADPNNNVTDDDLAKTTADLLELYVEKVNDMALLLKEDKLPENSKSHEEKLSEIKEVIRVTSDNINILPMGKTEEEKNLRAIKIGNMQASAYSLIQLCLINHKVPKYEKRRKT